MTDRSDFTQEDVKIGDVRVDLARGLGRKVGGGDLIFTDQERRILRQLVAAGGDTVSRDALHEAVWGAPLPLGSRAVDVALHRLRAKLEGDARRPIHLLTVRGEGYRLVLEEPQLLSSASPGERIVLPTCVIDLGSRRVERGGRVRDLGRAEVAVLKALASRPGQTISTRDLLELGWGESSGDPGRVRTAIMRLRKKIEEDSARPRFLLTRDGGFSLIIDPGADTRTGASALGSVPARGDRFFGRGAELTKLRELFGGGARLVTLQAVGGCGKTRLAVEFARSQLGPDWSGGVWFCDLTEAWSAADCVSAIASVLGLAAGEAFEADPVQGLGTSLEPRGPTLLVLDNLEQVHAPAVETVAALLAAAPDLAVLTTSRVRLGLRDERMLRLEPLPVDDALDLLQDRSESVGDVQVDRKALARVVERLDALPLALELVAGYAALLSPDQLLARLERRLGLSATGNRDLPGRHATLRDMMDWSWKLLTPLEARALAQCAVFRGAFTVEDAEQVMDLGSLAPGAGTLEALRILVDRSLLQAVRPDDPRAEPGFRMFEVVREFGEEQLDELTARDDLILSHETWYLALGERLVERLQGADPATPLARLATSADNLADILRRARRTPKTAARAAACLVPLLARRGPAWRLKQVAERAVESARRAGDPALLARALLQRAQAGGERIPPAERAELAQEAAEQARLARAHDLEASALLVEAAAHRQLGHLQGAEARAQAAVKAAADGSVDDAAGAALCELARQQALRDRDRSTRTLHLALQTARRDGLRHREADACLLLGRSYREAGLLDDADDALAIGVEAAAATGLPGLQAELRLESAAVDLTRGSLAEARAVLEELLEDRMGHGPVLQAAAQAHLGLIDLLEGHYRGAYSRFQAARAGRQVAGWIHDPRVELWEGLGRMIEGAPAHAMLSGARAAADRAGSRLLSEATDDLLRACEGDPVAADAPWLLKLGAALASEPEVAAAVLQASRDLPGVLHPPEVRLLQAVIDART